MTTTPAGDVSNASKDGPSGQAFGRPYWMCNSIEMFERLAYFGIRSVVPIYIMQATEPGGLHLTAAHKGWIYAWWAVFQSFLPMVTGGFADRYGYKRVLAFAISMNVIGYVMMAYLQGYYGFFAGILVLATGTAFFKPALQGSLAANLTKKNSSLGWGIFYWVVNVGAVGAPILATIILGKPHSAEGWRNLFLASAAYTCVNLLLLLTFKDVPSGASKVESLPQVLGRTIANVWPYWFLGGKLSRKRFMAGALLMISGIAMAIVQPGPWLYGVLAILLIVAGVWLLCWLREGQFTWQLRLPAWLLIMSCFWLMMYQLWDLHPNFIEDWVDSSMVAAHIPVEGWKEYGDRGIIRVPQQILLNLNAALIILLMLPVSWLVRKMRTLSCMLIGMSIATGGVLVAGLTGNGSILLLGIVFFSLGEMLTGPKKNEYLGLIAPKGKKGLYLGYVNIPVGVGVGIGSWLAGYVYGNYGEKASLALQHLGANTHLVARAAESVDWSDSLELIPALLEIERSNAFELASGELGQDPGDAAKTLRGFFRFDRQQITNLGLVYLATHAEYRKEATADLAEILVERSANEESQRVGRKLAEGALTIDQIGVARFVDLLPKALGIKRPQVFEILRAKINRGVAPERVREDAAIVDMLWDRAGLDRETLNNLALEYLAQGTHRMRRAVASIRFEDPMTEIESRLGIGRTKSFAALVAALGADEATTEQALTAFPGSPTDKSGDQAYIYLIQQPHHRFNAVGRKDWTKDVGLLEAIIESDPAAMEAVLAQIDRKSWNARLWAWVGELFGASRDVDKTLAERLATRQDLIQKALDRKEWTKSPELAARVLGLNPFEARTLVASELNRAPVTATRVLWDTYHPQYKVWIPFAAIGVFAAIALAIFGHRAKRWSDMNA